MKLLRVLAVLVLVACLAASAHLAHAFLQPASGPDRVTAQVRWLNAQRAAGAAGRMQELFPEGEFFTHLLTGLAAASVSDSATVDSALQATETSAIKQRFGSIAELDGGTFYRGWRLLLLTERVRLTGGGPDALLAEAAAVQNALATAPTGVPASYPGGYWPCDAVVAMAAVVRARNQVGSPADPAGVAAWRAKLDRLRDPATGLLPHRISAGGDDRELPRGSSQAIIQTFWPEVDAAGAPGQWRRFVAAFVVREAGLVGVREYPLGYDGAGDEDSGPLLFGVSASASAVTLAAARRNGAAELAADLDHQAEYLGLPLEWAGERRFAFGVMPVGDAFVAWARSVPDAPASGSAAPRPLWWAYALVLLLPAIAVAVVAVPHRRRTRVSTGSTSVSPGRAAGSGR